MILLDECIYRNVKYFFQYRKKSLMLTKVAFIQFIYLYNKNSNIVKLYCNF